MNRINCGDINKSFIGKDVNLKGWLKNIRNLGSLLFLEVQDITGMIQCVIDDKHELFKIVESYNKESVVSIIGIIQERKSKNPNIKNGDIELIIKTAELLSNSITPPLLIQNETDALEETRFQYRYLDLRRPNIQNIFIFRSKMIQLIHEYFKNQNFYYIETPILAKPTPEGARDYLVPARTKEKSFFALPQSPQIYKQLLMVSGFERYYQIAKCFRDEDLRSDRQPEFTQLDIETSFLNEEDIQNLTEGLLQFLFKYLLNIDIKLPLPRMDYDYAMLHYGCDKPDTRFENLIQDITDLFNNNKSHQLLIENKFIRVVGFNQLISRKQIDELDQFLEKSSYKKSIWIKRDNGIYYGSITKKINNELLDKIFNNLNIENGTVFINIDEKELVSIQLGVIRNFIATSLKLIDNSLFNLLWIVNWPLFEYNNIDKRYYAAHHPFTQPQQKYHNNFWLNQSEAKARSYDIVLNGVELGGGSIRINDLDMQLKMFQALNISNQVAYEKFQTLLDAFKYGVPPHGGIAIGIDRFVQLLLNLSSIKECIAFPKNNKAYDPTIQTPSSIDQFQLDELNLEFKKGN